MSQPAAGGEAGAGAGVDRDAAGLDVVVLDALPAAVLVLDDANTIVWANRTALRLPLTERTARHSIDHLRDAVRFPDGVPAPGPQRTCRTPVEVVTAPALLRAEATTVGLADGRRVLTFAVESTDTPSAHERRLETMLAHTRDIITVLDGDGTIQYSNVAAGTLLGLSGDETNGMSAIELVHPDDQAAAMQVLEQILFRTHDGSPLEVRLRFANGEWRHVDEHLDDPDVHALVLTVHDISERVDHAAELAASEQRLRSLVEHLSDVVVVLDAELNVIYASPGIEQLIDAPAYTNLGEHAFNDIHPDDVSTVATLITDLIDRPGASDRAEFRLDHARRGWRWVDATIVNRLDDDAVQGLVCTLRDVTDERRAGAELEEAFRRERDAAEQLREADHLKDDFLATVSHELRTPLTSIAGFASLLESGRVEDDAVRLDMLRRIAENSREMQGMVEQLLDFSRLQASSVSVDIRDVHLGAAVAEMIDRLHHQLADHEVVTDIGDLAVRADPDALAHVLRNLLTNAAKYSPAGSMISLTAGPSDGEPGHVAVAVRDQGIGIAPDDQNRVFHRFFQVRSGATTSTRGAGVGLNIARRYVQLMSGRMRLESALGEGSTFVFTLPRVGPG